MVAAVVTTGGHKLRGPFWVAWPVRALAAGRLMLRCRRLAAGRLMLAAVRPVPTCSHQLAAPCCRLHASTRLIVMPHPKHIDHLLHDWPYRFGEVLARKVRGKDRREVLQMRVDMGVLQMEVDGRPDGERPEGFETYYDYLVSLTFHEGEEFALTGERCMEIDREFVQFYHRRICWLAVKDYRKAARDADHTLALMDFSTANSPDESWSLMHEQYRPFVLFHRTQALALANLDKSGPEDAVKAIDEGLDELHEIFEEHEADDEFEESELVVKLREMRRSLVEHYELGPSLAEQLSEAIAKEEYERAAELRDRIRSHQGR